MPDFNPEEFVTIPDGWSCKRLADCTSDGNISYGIVQPGQHVDDGVPVIRVNNVNNGQLKLSDVLKVSPEVESKYERTRLKGGEVLLTLVGTTGQSFVAPNELRGWNVPRAIAVIRVNKGVGAEWINLCLQSKNTKHFLDVRANTTVQKTLNLKDVRDIPILIPPKETKVEIESTALSFSKKIGLLREQNKTLETLAQTIFKEWFVNFNYPDATGEMVDSELGEIPKGWRVGKLGGIGNNIRTGVSSGEIKPEMNYIALEHMPRKSIALNSWVSAGKVASNKFKFKKGNILFGKLRPYFHKVGTAFTSGICSTDILVIEPKKEFQQAYLLMILSSDEFIQYVTLASEGTRMPRTSWNYMKEYIICIPSEDIMTSFNVLVSNLVDKIGNNIFQIEALSKTRDVLLPKLMSGEIRVNISP